MGACIMILGVYLASAHLIKGRFKVSLGGGHILSLLLYGSGYIFLSFVKEDSIEAHSY